MYIRCGCTRELMAIEKFDDEYIISLYIDCFSAQQENLYRSIWGKIKAACFMLVGKSYRLFDLCLNKEQFEDFKNEINIL